ncbi:MAG: hypothetical protein JWP63_2764 [Candidatus Solibacter sp.]|jgi:hypothetical protein|nr:hypothetical protein [Candidatus Solibacter sp.]
MRTFSLFILITTMAVSVSAQGVERWSVKTSVADGTDFKKVTKVPLADLLAVKDAEGVTHNDKRFKTERIPAPNGDKYPEGKLVSTTGWLHLVAGEPDGDYHIQISDSQTSGDHCLVVEVPNEGAKFTATPDLRPKFQAVRDLIKTKMLAGKNPSASGSVMQHPVYVTVTGVMFYDDSHVGDQPRGKKGMKAATLWELHPVTGIAFAVKPK